MQSRLERLVLHSQPLARFLCRHPLDVAQHHRGAVDRRQREDGGKHTRAELGPQHVLVGHVRPIGHVVARRAGLVAVVRGQRQLFGLCPLVLRRAEARHRRVEGDPIDPGRQRCVAAKRAHLAVDLEEHVLRDLFRVFLVAQVSEGELENLPAVHVSQVTQRTVVSGLESFNQRGVPVNVAVGSFLVVCGVSH